MPSPRTHGMRFFWTDGIVLLVGIIATWMLWPLLQWHALLIPIVLGHFFLFCNVIRLHRNYELLWAACFVVHVALWEVLTQTLPWGTILLYQTPLTLLLFILEVRSPRYHGIWSHRLNPHLEKWLHASRATMPQDATLSSPHSKD